MSGLAEFQSVSTASLKVISISWQTLYITCLALHNIVIQHVLVMTYAMRIPVVVFFRCNVCAVYYYFDDWLKKTFLARRVSPWPKNAFGGRNAQKGRCGNRRRYVEIAV